MKNVILILGMHRSGTSVLTRVVSLLGATLPKSLLGKNASNPRGHWESEAMISAHEALLKEHNSNWKDWRRLDLGNKTSRSILKARGMFSNVFTSEYSGENEVCVVKEPRICRFAAPYIAMLEEESEALYSIIMIRNPIEVAASLTARDGLEKLDGLYLWLTYTLEAELATRGRSRQFLSHQGLMNSPVKTAQSLSKALPFKLTYQVNEVKKHILSYVSPDLNRQQAAIEDIVLDPIARGWVSSAYEACLILCENPESQAALETLDNIRESYFSVIEPLHDIITAERARMSGELKSQLVEKQAEHEAGIAALQSDHSRDWKARDEETAKAWQLREQEHAKALEQLTQNYEHALKSRDAESRKGRQARDEETAKAWQLRDQEQAKTLAAHLMEHEQALKLRDQEHEKALNIVQKEHAFSLEYLEKSFAETFENLQAEHNKAKAEWDRSFSRQDADHQATVSNMNLEMNFMRDEFGKILRTEEARVDKNAADLDAMRAEMSDVFNSTSWKMTSGLRRAMNLLKGIKFKDATSRLNAPNTPPRLEYKPED